MTVLTHTYCVRIVRADGVIKAMTALDRDVVYGGITYEKSLSYTPSETETTANLSVNNSDKTGALDIAGISRDDLINGLYNNAELYELIVNYETGTLVKPLQRGFLGEVELTNTKFSIEFRSMSQLMQQVIGDKYVAECSNQLGDTFCGVNLADFTETGTITGVTSNRVFTDTARLEADAWFAYGDITFTSGNNAGRTRQVKLFSGGEFTTFLPFPYEIQTGDAYEVYAGCDKRKIPTCRYKFDRVCPPEGGGYRGYDAIRGLDSLMQ